MGPARVLSGATLKGSGSFAGGVTIDPSATISPGNSPGTLTVGSLALSDSSHLTIELGTNAATSDHIAVTGDVVLDGIVDLSFANGATFNTFSHDFLTFTGTLTDNFLRLGSLPSGVSPSTLAFSLSSPHTLSLITARPGDADLNGIINADDYVLIDRGYLKHIAGRTNGDFNLDGTIDAADYLIIDQSLSSQGPLAPYFIAQRESEFGPDYVSQLLASIPEPTSVLVGILPIMCSRRRAQ
jgi:hypothetical protein